MSLTLIQHCNDYLLTEVVSVRATEKQLSLDLVQLCVGDVKVLGSVAVQ